MWPWLGFPATSRAFPLFAKADRLKTRDLLTAGGLAPRENGGFSPGISSKCRVFTGQVPPAPQREPAPRKTRHFRTVPDETPVFSRSRAPAAPPRNGRASCTGKTHVICAALCKKATHTVHFRAPPPGRKNHVFLWCFFDQKTRIFTHGSTQVPPTAKTRQFPHPRSTPPAKSGPKTRAELARENTAFSEGFAPSTRKHGVLGPPNTPENTALLPCAVRNADRT